MSSPPQRAELRHNGAIEKVLVPQVHSRAGLAGLTGTVIDPHPTAAGWVMVRLDQNDRVGIHEWPVPVERLKEIAPQK